MKNGLSSLGYLAIAQALVACHGTPAAPTGQSQLGVEIPNDQTGGGGDGGSGGDGGDGPGEATACADRDGLGIYHGFFCISDGPFITTEEVSCQDALDNCELNAAANPDQNLTCLWNGELILEREVTAGACPDSTEACMGLDGLGSYRGHLCGSGLISTEFISCEDAWSNCALNAALNPDLSFSCTWNGVDIFSREVEPGACEDLDDPCVGLEGHGSYRGYFCEHDGLIATEDISCPEALANCSLNAEVNPTESITCTWNGVDIFTQEVTPDACASFP